MLRSTTCIPPVYFWEIGAKGTQYRLLYVFCVPTATILCELLSTHNGVKRYKSFIGDQAIHMLHSAIPPVYFWEIGAKGTQYRLPYVFLCSYSYNIVWLLSIHNGIKLYKSFIGDQAIHMLRSAIPPVYFWEIGAKETQYRGHYTKCFLIITLYNVWVNISI